jgi:hypothetical protein
MTKYKPLILLLLFGSIWGMSEVVLGGIFDEINIAHSSVWLNAWAIFVLAVSRGVLNKPGSSTALGVIAATFKLANTTPFYCHLLGIFLMGVAFDLAATVLLKKNHKIDYRNCICGVVSAYGGYALFAVIITYLIRYDYWVSGGLSKVLHHIFVSGSYLALAAAAAVPLGFMAGLKGRTLRQYHSPWVFRGALLTSAIIWLLGRIDI